MLVFLGVNLSDLIGKILFSGQTKFMEESTKANNENSYISGKNKLKNWDQLSREAHSYA